MREKITQALKARAEAIKKALNRHNEHALKLQPPRPTLSWKEIVEMAAVADFDLLRETREDIRKQPWTKPLNRRAMNLRFNIERAHEEIARLNVEIRRLLTSMYDEHVDFHIAVQAASTTSPDLAFELEERLRYRNRINEQIALRLIQTSRLTGFTGSLATGLRVGRDVTRNDGIPLPPWATGLVVSVPDDSDGSLDADNDEEHLPLVDGLDSERDANAYIDFVDELGRDE